MRAAAAQAGQDSGRRGLKHVFQPHLAEEATAAGSRPLCFDGVGELHASVVLQALEQLLHLGNSRRSTTWW